MVAVGTLQPTSYQTASYKQGGSLSIPTLPHGINKKAVDIELKVDSILSHY